MGGGGALSSWGWARGGCQVVSSPPRSTCFHGQSCGLGGRTPASVFTRKGSGKCVWPGEWSCTAGNKPEVLPPAPRTALSAQASGLHGEVAGGCPSEAGAPLRHKLAWIRGYPSVSCLKDRSLSLGPWGHQLGGPQGLPLGFDQ